MLIRWQRFGPNTSDLPPDRIEVIACSPHIMPDRPTFRNAFPSIRMLMKFSVRQSDRCSALRFPQRGGARDGHGLNERSRGRLASRCDAVAVPADGPIVLDGKFNEEIWQQAPAIIDFVQREPAEGQPPTHAHRSAHRLRRRGALCGGARLRHRRRQDSSASSRAAISARPPTGSASSSTRTSTSDRRTSSASIRWASRPIATTSTTARATTAGTRCGTSQVERDADGWRAEFRIPFSQLRFNNTRRRPGRLRGDSRGRPPGRDVDLAAAVAQRQRLRLAVRRAARPEDGRRAEEVRAAAVHASAKVRHAAGRAPAIRSATRPIPAARSAST